MSYPKPLVLAVLLFLCLLVACPNQDEEYDRVNQDSDCLEVVVSPDDGDDDDSAGDDDDSAGDDDDSAGEESEDATEVEIQLTGRTGFFDMDVIGSARVEPARAPAGTRFDLVVTLQDTGADQGNPTDVVDRATVLVDNGTLTLNEFDLSPSPADESRWVLTLEAGGDSTTTRRTDQLCVALYTEI